MIVSQKNVFEDKVNTLLETYLARIESEQTDGDNAAADAVTLLNLSIAEHTTRVGAAVEDAIGDFDRVLNDATEVFNVALDSAH